MTTLLAIDTATENCSVALLHNAETTFQNQLVGNTATKIILPMVDKILAQSGINLSQVDAIIFGQGPGSFTGVRVATGVVQGLAFGVDIPAIPVSNLTAMAEQAWQEQGASLVLSAIDARMQEVYFSLNSTFDEPNLASSFRIEEKFSIVNSAHWQNLISEQVGSAEYVISQLDTLNLADLKQRNCIVPVGTGILAYSTLQAYFADYLTQHDLITLPEARYMLPLGLEKFNRQQWLAPEEVEPVYLRNDVAKKATAKSNLKLNLS